MSCVGIIFHVGIMAVSIHKMLRTRGWGFNSSVICSNLYKHCKCAYKNLDRYVQTTRFMWIWYNLYLAHRSNKHNATPIVKLFSMDEKCHGSSHWFAIKEPHFFPILNALCNVISILVLLLRTSTVLIDLSQWTQITVTFKYIIACTTTSQLGIPTTLLKKGAQSITRSSKHFM